MSTREREFRAARRRSALVRVLRWGLPALGVVALAVFAVSYLARSRLADIEKAGVAMERVELTRDGVVMDRPHISGTTAKGQRFEVRAERAWQQPGNPKLINFQVIEAELGLPDGGEALIAAREGLYDSEGETLTMVGEVSARSNQGYAVHAEQAFVDLRAGLFRTERPIVLESEEMRVEARGATVVGGESRADFVGPVRVLVKPRGSAPGL